MAKLSVITRADAPSTDTYPVGRVARGMQTCALQSPPGFPLWVCDVALDDAATIEWRAPHGDDGLYVLDGELEIDGRRCPAGGAIIVESGVETVATSVGASRLIHFGSVDSDPPSGGLLGAPEDGAHGVHVVGPAGQFQSGEDEGVRAVWFSDGTCPTCRCQLFEVTSPPRDGTRGKPHSHSADEIIFVLEGTITMGSYTLGPFTALSVPGDVRYALVGQPSGHRFLNFRRDVSEQIYELNSAPILETGLARGGHATNDVR